MLDIINVEISEGRLDESICFILPIVNWHPVTPKITLQGEHCYPANLRELQVRCRVIAEIAYSRI
jgi:hypothetical protein